ncbi:hypothetical protein TruAng_009493 [Truncatella angustata]|nr:hypothetical protein TruAng_009493 [Truncatella angustata]
MTSKETTTEGHEPQDEGQDTANANEPTSQGDAGDVVVNFKEDILKWYENEVVAFEDETANQYGAQLGAILKTMGTEANDLGITVPEWINNQRETLLEDLQGIGNARGEERAEMFSEFTNTTGAAWKKHVTSALEKLRERASVAEYDEWAAAGTRDATYHKLRELESQVQGLKEDMVKVEQESAVKAREDVKSDLEELERFRTAWDEHEKGLGEMKSQLKDAQNKVKKEVEELQRVNSRADQNHKDFVEAKNAAEDWKEQLKQAQTEKKTIQDALDGEKTRVSRLVEKNEELNTLIQELRTQIRQRRGSSPLFSNQENVDTGFTSPASSTKESTADEEGAVGLSTEPTENFTYDDETASQSAMSIRSVVTSRRSSTPVESIGETTRTDPYGEYLGSVLRRIIHQSGNGELSSYDLLSHIAVDHNMMLHEIAAMLAQYSRVNPQLIKTSEIRSSLVDLNKWLVDRQNLDPFPSLPVQPCAELTERDTDGILEFFDESDKALRGRDDHEKAMRAGLEKKTEGLERRNQDLQKQVNTVKDQLEDCQTTRVELREEIEAKLTEQAEANGTIEITEKELEAKNSEVEGLKTQLHGANINVADLTEGVQERQKGSTSTAPQTQDYDCATCKKIREPVKAIVLRAISEMRRMESILQRLLEEERQRERQDESSAALSTDGQEKQGHRMRELEMECEDYRQQVIEAARELEILQQYIQNNDPETIPPVIDDAVNLQQRNEQLRAEVDQVNVISKKLLVFYQRMQQVMKIFRDTKQPIDADLDVGQVAFAVDLDLYLEADLKKLRARMEKLEQEPPTASDEEKRQNQIQKKHVKREIEKHEVLLSELDIYSKLADEAMSVSEVCRLDPAPNLLHVLLKEDDANDWEHVQHQGSGQGESDGPQGDGTIWDGAQPGGLALPFPSLIPLLLMLTTIMLFMFGFVTQQQLKERWAVANNFSRALWVNDDTGSVPSAWVYLAIFVVLNFTAFYKGR